MNANNERTFEDFVGDAIIDVEEEDSDEQPALPAARGDVDVVDADVVNEQQMMNRHDRAAFAEVEQQRRISRSADARVAHDAALDQEEAEALAQADAFARDRRYREEYRRAMKAGLPPDMAETRAERFADAPDTDRSGPRRPRTSEARIVSG